MRPNRASKKRRKEKKKLQREGTIKGLKKTAAAMRKLAQDSMSGDILYTTGEERPVFIQDSRRAGTRAGREQPQGGLARGKMRGSNGECKTHGTV